jgi:hypothetical protein
VRHHPTCRGNCGDPACGRPVANAAVVQPQKDGGEVTVTQADRNWWADWLGSGCLGHDHAYVAAIRTGEQDDGGPAMIARHRLAASTPTFNRRGEAAGGAGEDRLGYTIRRERIRPRRLFDRPERPPRRHSRRSGWREVLSVGLRFGGHVGVPGDGERICGRCHGAGQFSTRFPNGRLKPCDACSATGVRPIASSQQGEE